MQQQIVYAGRVASSNAFAADLLEHLAQLPVPPKQVERLTRCLGAARAAQRDESVAAFQALPLAEKFDAPSGVEPPELAVVFVDGGRLQIRERTDQTAEPAEPQAEPGQWEPEPLANQGHWREDKVGLLAAMKSQPCRGDPCPEIPPGFLDVLRIPMLARELGKVAAGGEGEASATERGPAPPPAQPAGPT